jgi:hypothetical protein
MTAGGTTVELGVQQDGLVQVPWSISGRKNALRGFAETLAALIPGAIVYETPKLWNVSKVDKRRINVLELLEAAATLRLVADVLDSEVVP